MTKKEFESLAVQWAIDANIHDMEAHLKVCKEEYNELFNADTHYRTKTGKADKILCEKEWADVLWTMAILEYLDDEHPFLELMEATLEDHAEHESAEMMQAVVSSNYSKFMLVSDSWTYEMAVREADIQAEIQANRYTGIVPKKVKGGWALFDDKGKLVKPSCYIKALALYSSMSN